MTKSDPTAPLSDELLATIRAELERTTDPDWRPHTTIGKLLAEVDRLRAETDSLHVVVERASVAQYSASDRATNLAEQMGRLIIEGNRLRAALATAESLAAEYGARIVAASMAAAPREIPGAGR
jgi:hypothetical protein